LPAATDTTFTVILGPVFDAGEKVAIPEQSALVTLSVPV
jgi:hypothetical protein